MTSDFETVLEDCLQRLAEGETAQLCLERYPEHASELKPLLQAATRLGEQSQLRPSLAVKSRTRAKLYAHMDAHPRQRYQAWKRLLFPFSRMAIGLATLMLAFALTGAAVAQSALPGATFYSWKLASERTWRAVSPDPVGFDLSLVERRVNELVAVSGNETAQETALNEYRRAVRALEYYEDTDAQTRIQQALKVQQERLLVAGIVDDPETPVATLVVASSSTPIPLSTDVVSSPVSTSTSTDIVSTQIIPTDVIPTVKIPTAAPTIKAPTVVPTTIKMPTVVPTTIKLPTIIKLPTVVLPTLRIPTVVLPTIRIPTIEIPDIPGLP